MQRKGIALVMTLIFVLIFSLLAAIAYYLLHAETRVSFIQKKQVASEEIAKGVSNYLFNLMDKGEFCKIANCSGSESSINLGNYSDFDNYVVNATLIKTIDTGDGKIYVVRLYVWDKQLHRKITEVEFAYKAH